jgi:hypothetical protein
MPTEVAKYIQHLETQVYELKQQTQQSNLDVHQALTQRIVDLEQVVSDLKRHIYKGQSDDIICGNPFDTSSFVFPICQTSRGASWS